MGIAVAMNKRELEEREQKLVAAFYGERSSGFFVEVGAHDPRLLSQTWHLEQKGWRGILVEPSPEFAASLRRQRRNSTVVQVACSSPEKRGEALFHFADAAASSGLEKNVDDPTMNYRRSEKVRVVTLDDILRDAGDPKVDFVSIDVEGTELDVLRGFDLSKHQPSLLLVEDKVNNLKKHFYLKRQRYRLVRRTSLNNWYIPEGASYNMTPWSEKVRLFRKMYLGTPWRRLKLEIKRRRGTRQRKSG